MSEILLLCMIGAIVGLDDRLYHGLGFFLPNNLSMILIWKWDISLEYFILCFPFHIESKNLYSLCDISQSGIHDTESCDFFPNVKIMHWFVCLSLKQDFF
eukprot:TRINITY_DN1013_c1_g1_i3.p1 TRINITY_DN1013_c1_g1~~TRINITY_DN1013_c1_g1_i3.p1  ORF type:complete len:100 (-),score=2.25 TRINITY_DN1013_c1_g1_i3:901-1200(-)